MDPLIIPDIGSLDGAAQDFLKHFNAPAVFAFYGEMGAGKTTFIKALCKRLQVEDVVTSPTFALVNEYTTSQNRKVFHLDFYRIESVNEVFDLGYEEYFYQHNYCFIEWPELIEILLPQDTVRVSVKVGKDGARIISVDQTL